MNDEFYRDAMLVQCMPSSCLMSVCQKSVFCWNG